ncbi:hypothetical protein PP175_08100 [Aneurinibacillus sp. Ricciae_BoGa-3]|uniref:hypothetical protein n=1 Tax=Aneurinibacillus sp. Ricciae_BoGa-3 TaxID=3022697 RepID=UPI00233FB1F6|nr:hypothetical protein [Aneurinibacillus sp. Ricciae_BoGa-3]WCK55874.1 hypothetical protein PP175_08100 [Aneurinibacillus sp. Ricciae_BoGa-3]
MFSIKYQWRITKYNPEYRNDTGIYKKEEWTSFYDIGDLIGDFDEISVENTPLLSRLILREHLWCKLEYESEFFVHFGYDYYMYVGSSIQCKDTIKKITKEFNLFVEHFNSPHLD